MQNVECRMNEDSPEENLHEHSRREYITPEGHITRRRRISLAAQPQISLREAPAPQAQFIRADAIRPYFFSWPPCAKGAPSLSREGQKTGRFSVRRILLNVTAGHTSLAPKAQTSLHHAASAAHHCKTKAEAVSGFRFVFCNYSRSGTFALTAAISSLTLAATVSAAVSIAISSRNDLSRAESSNALRERVLGEMTTRTGEPNRSASENMTPAETGRSS
jgi:hypothetical protein